MRAPIHITAAALALLVSASAQASPRGEQHYETCRGKLISTDPESGDSAKIGKCIIIIDDPVSKPILDKCRFNHPCVARALVDDADLITHVYSAARTVGRAR